MSVEDLISRPCGKKHWDSLSDHQKRTFRQAGVEGYTFKRMPNEGSTTGKITDALFEVYMGKILAGPMTLGVNPVSLSIMTSMRFGETLGAIAASNIARTKTERLKMNEFHAEVAEFQVGMREAVEFISNRFDLKNNRGTSNTEIAANTSGIPAELLIRSKLDTNKQTIQADTWDLKNPALRHIVDYTGFLVSLPGTTLGTTDLVWKIMNFHATAGKLSMRQANFDMEEKIRENPDLEWDPEFVQRRYETNLQFAKAGRVEGKEVNEIFDASVHDADIRAFTAQAETGIGKAIVNAQWFGFRWVVPLRRAIIGALEASLNRGPVGWMIKSSQTHKDLFSKSPARKADAVGRMAMGSILAGGLAGLFWDQLDGAPPREQYERDRWEAAGHRAYTINLGGGYHIPFRALGGIEFPLKALANIREYANSADWDTADESDVHLTNMMTAWVIAAADTMINDQWTNDVYQFMRAAFQTKQDNKVNKKHMQVYLERKVDTMIAGNFLQIWTKGVDPYKHDLKEPWDGLIARLPEYSKGVANRINFWGNKVLWKGGIDPAQHNEFKDGDFNNDPIEKELKRVGFKYPKTNRSKMGVKTTPEEFERWSIYVGKGKPGAARYPSMYQRLEKEINHPSYNSWKYEKRKVMQLRMVVKQARALASELLYKDPDFPDFKKRVDSYEEYKRQLDKRK